MPLNRLQHRAAGALITSIAPAALALGAPTGARAGDCDWTLGSVQLGFVPDFDQIRQGLPNNGYAVCVPTAALNWMAWLDTHGHPSLMPFPPTNWQSQSAFNNVSAAILEMAGYMGTDLTNGTDWGGYKDGAETWLDTYADADDFTVGYAATNGAYVPSSYWLWAMARSGYLTTITVGWYELKPYPFGAGNAWFRDGGHIVSLNGIICNQSGQPAAGLQFRFRDPADDYYDFDLTGQSQFSSAQYSTTSVTARFTSKKTNPQASDFYQRTHYRVNGFAEFYSAVLPDHVAMFDGYGWIKPLGGYTTGINSLAVVTHDPNHLEYLAIPATQTHAATQTYIIADLVQDPLSQEIVFLARLADGSPDRIIRALSPETGDVRSIHDFYAAPRRAAFDRFGNLYLLDGPRLARIDLPGVATFAAPHASVVPPAPIDAIAYDDTHDLLYAYSGASNGVFVFPNHTRLPAAAFAAQTPVFVPLPGAPLTGDVFIAVDPRDGCLWLTSRDSRTVSEYTIDTTTWVATLADAFTDPDLVGATGLEVSRGGRLYMTKAQIIAEYSQDSRGAWSRSTQTAFAGLPSGGIFRLAIGRTNYTPGDIDSFQIVPPIPDCLGDLDGDGVVAAGDLAILLGSWGPCGPCAADLNGDGVANAADLALLLGAWGPCP